MHTYHILLHTVLRPWTLSSHFGPQSYTAWIGHGLGGRSSSFLWPRHSCNLRGNKGHTKQIYLQYIAQWSKLLNMKELPEAWVWARGGTVHVFILNWNDTGITVRCMNKQRIHGIKINKGLFTPEKPAINYHKSKWKSQMLNTTIFIKRKETKWSYQGCCRSLLLPSLILKLADEQ